MDEIKTTNPESGAGEKTFSQEDVNRIVGERLAKEKINEMGLPVELVDVLNVSSLEALEKALSIVKTVMDKQKAEARPIKFKGAKAGESLSGVRNTGDDSLRKAMGLPE